MAVGTAQIARALGSPRSVSFRRRVRYFAAAMATIVSGLYFLIGLQVVAVIQNPEDQAAFALPAAIAFAVGALVILLSDKRAVWVVGGVAQALIIFMYFAVAAQREPQFERWGISIRVAQSLLLVALGYLAVRRREPAKAAASPFRVGKAAT